MGGLMDILEWLSTFTVQPIIKQALSFNCLKQQLASLDYPLECGLIKEWRMSTWHGSCCHIHYEVQIEAAILQAGACIISESSDFGGTCLQDAPTYFTTCFTTWRSVVSLTPQMNSIWQRYIMSLFLALTGTYQCLQMATTEAQLALSTIDLLNSCGSEECCVMLRKEWKMNLELKLVRLLVNKLINYVYLSDLQHKTLKKTFT